MSVRKQDKDSKIAGVVGTVLVHLLLLLTLWFVGIGFPRPQQEEESGLTINYGDTEQGDGLFEPAPQQAIEEQLVPPSSPTSSSLSPSTEELLTQEDEESIAARETEKKKKEEEQKKREELRKQEDARRKQEQQRQAAVAKANSTVKNAFATSGKGSHSSATSEGVTGGSGNQDNPFGDVNSNNRSGGGSGSGHSYSLNGRSISGKLPEPVYDRNEEGVIVVHIEVDAQGKVVSAKAGAAGTTIADASLRREAEKAALRARFNGISGSYIQAGTITYRYKLY